MTVNLRVFSQLVYTVNLRKRLGWRDATTFQTNEFDWSTKVKSKQSTKDFGKTWWG